MSINSRKLQKEELKKMTMELCMAIKNEPKDEKTILNILKNTKNEDRQIIRKMYKELYEHTIQKDINEYLKDKLKDLTIDMFDTPYEYDARELHKALKNIMNEDEVIIEIFASRPKLHMDMVDRVYKKFYGVLLRDDIEKETNGIYQKILLQIMNVSRPVNNTIDKEKAKEIAKKINEETIEVFVKNIDNFTDVFLTKSREDLILISREYYQLFNSPLLSFISPLNLPSPKHMRLIYNLYLYIICPYEFFDFHMKTSTEGLKYDIRGIKRILLYRSYIDMKNNKDFIGFFLSKIGIDICDNELDDKDNNNDICKKLNDFEYNN